MSCISLAFHTTHVVATGRVEFNPSTAIKRSCFPKKFVFGTAGSSYQYEGAHHVDGKKLSIWDIFTQDHPEKIVDRSNGDVANDQYHRYKEDVALLNDMGMDAYRFSISWSRILPNGKLSGGVNRKGIQYYNNLIDELLSKGLQPFVTLFHWDVPQSLEHEYQGFLCERIISDFQDYAELCYKEFGDRVKHWITLNEPAMFSSGGYDSGIYAPGRCSSTSCDDGNSSIEPYITAHNQLLAHAAAVEVYKQKYQDHQKGKIGITLNCDWVVPSSNTRMDKDAAQRAIDFMFGWFMDPLTYGVYPKSMQSLVGKRLPEFSQEQSDMVKGSYDFLGLNYYTANYATHSPPSNDDQPSYTTDSHASISTEINGTPIGPPAAPSWLSVYPSGFHELLIYIKRRYNDPIIYITENGVAEFNNSTLSPEEALNDNMRIYYHDQHLKSLLSAIKEGVDVRGYFVWSLLDTFEWNTGYTVRFGLNYVDYKTLKRYPKDSSKWFKKFLLH